MSSSRNQMKTMSSDESLESFIFLSIIMIFILTFSLITFFAANNSLIKHIFSNLSVILIIFTIALLLFLIVLSLTTIFVYRTGNINPLLSFLLKIELNFLLPVFIAYSGFFKINKINIKKFFIRLNNIMIDSMHYKYEASKVLILLPHCLQNSGCNFKITNNINNCRKCMNCCIGEITEVAVRFSIPSVEVVTGGTAARNIIPKINPELIIAVACEGDLAAGIADVKKVPVIGILNKRPNGPCFNTTMDMDELIIVLKKVVKNIE